MRYLSANTYFRNRFGRKMYKASVSLDVTCPNRDGSKGTGGCIFCSAGGSGEFAAPHNKSVNDQIDEAISRVSAKVGDDAGYIAYFQSFTNTYCSPGYLKDALESAARHPKVFAVALGTRPDCLSDDMVAMLAGFNEQMPLFVELGLQTSNDETAKKINRCYETSEFYDAVRRLRDKKIEVIAHVIFGLPGETKEDMMNSVRAVAGSGCSGIKFTCLYVLEGTVLADMYANHEFEVLGMEEYFDIVDSALDLLPEGMAVHRLTGDGPKRILIAPEWTKNKREVINYINRRFGNG